MADRACNPVVVEVTRGGFTESRHRGALAVVAGGRVLEARGDVAAPVLARSAVKPLQALAMVESGAADAFALSEIVAPSCPVTTIACTTRSPQSAQPAARHASR